MMPRWLEQRSTAALPLPLRPLSAVVPRRCRSPKRLRAIAERLPTPMAAERAADASQCPRCHRCCPAWRHARARWQQRNIVDSHFAQSHAIVAAAFHGANRPRLLRRCALHSLLLAAPLACSHVTSAATWLLAMKSHVLSLLIDDMPLIKQQS